MIVVFVMIILLILFVNKKFANSESKSKFPAQLAMAAVAIAATVPMLFTENTGNQTFKYIAVGMGVFSAIAILYEAFLTKADN
ncbi:hypothetical protein [Oceanobacillus jeddahense]|uniref:Uncharacterized protein n=1 Tax=Oceanobacillus jeddahense TaxID=1462527 RepID=A0ABY5JRJ6_9BACI|nr:hypothetical protein [Oceanobacillus jeddahense]UUI01239.1 hypothetical protein NP439_14345 [Oceanobacillus jeddahense]